MKDLAITVRHKLVDKISARLKDLKYPDWIISTLKYPHLLTDLKTFQDWQPASSDPGKIESEVTAFLKEIYTTAAEGCFNDLKELRSTFKNGGSFNYSSIKKRQEIFETYSESCFWERGQIGEKVPYTFAKACLAAAGALTPEGSKTAPEMETELDNVMEEFFIFLARDSHRSLIGCYTGKPNLYCQQIELYLKEANADYSALDPEGKRTDAEMKAEVEQARENAQQKAPGSEIKNPTNSNKPGITEPAL